MRQFTRIDPLDLTEDRAIGVLLPFGDSPTPIFTSTYETKDALKVNLINFLLTEPGERYLNPSLGTPLRGLLFENLTPGRLVTVKEFLVDSIQSTFVRVKVNDLILRVDNNTLVVEIKYSIKDTPIEDEIILNIET